MDKNKDTIIVVCGPTASGKTGLALALCAQFNGELVNADSMQVYKGLPIGTAAPTPQETGDIPVHLASFLPPETTFSVADYLNLARPIIADINCRKKIPIVCGGTGLYLKSLIEGICFTEQKENPELKKKLEKEWEQAGPQQMFERLAQLDEEHALRLHVKDKKRILRALLQCIETGKTAKQREAESKPAEPPYNVLCIGLSFSMREELYTQINLRIESMLQTGLLQEAKTVFENQDKYFTAAQAIGYKEFFAYFEKTESLENCVLALKQATRRYAKRQVSWFGQMKYIHWLNADFSSFEKAKALVAEFLLLSNN